jgi:sterol desaturase/sphingolipid hydroxylase (fatty acid hydroxylase superfamily)
MFETVARDMVENSLQWITTGITVLSAVVLIILERIIPYTKGQKLFRDGFFNDFVLYTLVQSYVLGLVIFGVLHYIDSYTEIDRILSVRQWPIWLQVLFFLVTHDFYIYWFHRFQHKSSLFWRTHEAHHSTHDVDWLSGSRSHSLEILINQTIEFAPIILLASPEVALVKGCIDAVWGMYIHSNVDVRSGWLQYAINGPEMHRWHHATDDEAHNKNFSTKFAIWDWLFGTAYLPHGRKPSGFGLGPDYPTTYVQQHTYAFRPLED